MESGAAGKSPTNRHVGSVGRAIAVIDALAESSDGLGVNELARRIDVNPSSASRLLATLEHGGLTTRGADGRFRLGVRFLALADRVATQLDVRELARPHLRDLVERTGETATLSIPASGEAVTVDFIPGRSSVTSMATVGRPNPLHATAIGKTMLAFGGAIESPDPTSMTPFTTKTIRSTDELDREIELVRDAGWADSIGEREDDLAALAAPVFGGGGEMVAVIGLQAPLSRMGKERRRQLLPEVLRAAAELSQQLGAE